MKGLSGLLIAAACLGSLSAAAQTAANRVQAASLAEASAWSVRIDRMVAAGDLLSRLVREDTLVAGRRHERYAQMHRGLPVWGGELVRQSDLAGALTVFGTLYEGIDVDTTSRLSVRDVEGRLAERGGTPFGREGGPELLILPMADGSYKLAYRVRAAFSESLAITQWFIDARTGETLLEYNDVKTQSSGVSGTATGVLGDQKKISVQPGGAGFVTDDKFRPPILSTYDFRFSVGRLVAFLNSGTPSNLTAGDLGTDADNMWTDGALGDAHVYAGYVYDYYFKRHGRRGLDNANIPIRSVTHMLRREDWPLYPPDIIFAYFVNAAYLGDGVMIYGDGLPPNVTLGGQRWNYLAGGLDVVGHELTHGVTDYSSRLIYQGESGALNEAFSDMMGTAIEFFFQPEKADYLLGEDVVTPGGIRSMQNPVAYGDPDHYSLRYTGSEDSGGVHSNSGIANNAYYLAIEGGTHRLGGVVRGVGATNREQIEKVFYRAFTSFLPPSATFAQARAATIQAARELYGVGGAPERAVQEAWTAVGVN
jgi:thermolysin